MNAPPASTPPRKLRVATVSLAGCFGCHMSLLDIDERLFELIERVEFDRSPLTDIKTVGDCDVGLIEGGLCNAENVEVRSTRAETITQIASQPTAQLALHPAGLGRTKLRSFGLS